MSDSTRVKLYLAKNRLENESDFSDAYIRIYNRSLKENYNIWLTIEHKVGEIFHEYWKEEDEGRLASVLTFIGRITIACCKKFAAWKLKVCRFLYSKLRKKDSGVG